MSLRILVRGDRTGFAEDKDAARELRVGKLIPALERGEKVILDFGDVEFATQSFIHALIGEPLVRFREKALNEIEFKNCNKKVRGLIEIVVDYSLGGFVPNL